jgi:two-component sensor histidine kinase
LIRFILKDDQDAYYSFRKKLVATDSTQMCVLRMTKGDGKSFWAHLEGSVASGEGEAILYRIVLSDITERKQAEEFLRSSLEEKTTLLKEVHHRVKNNLQIVASLLNLQASRLEDARMVAAFRNVEGRIVSMALLHEALYRSDSLSRIDFSAYVEKLCGQLLRSFDSLSNKVTLERRIASIGLSLERSVPCGLIINELVSNALKHAFPGGRAGKIVVEMSFADGDLVVLGVRDDGVGLPAGFDAATSPTLGLRLVQKLAQQLGGRCETENTGNEGTSIRLSFPIDTEEMVGSQA